MRFSSIHFGGYLPCILIAVAFCADPQCTARLDANQLPRIYSGQYKNPAYGFSVVIPSGFVGRDVDNPLYQRGFNVLFPDHNSRISVYADVNSLDWPTAKKAADALSSFDSEERIKVISQQRIAVSLNGHSAYRTAFDYTCAHDRGGRFSSIFIVALSADKRIYYTLRWDGKRANRKSGEEVLQLLMDSWRFNDLTS